MSSSEYEEDEHLIDKIEGVDLDEEEEDRGDTPLLTSGDERESDESDDASPNLIIRNETDTKYDQSEPKPVFISEWERLTQELDYVKTYETDLQEAIKSLHNKEDAQSTIINPASFTDFSAALRYNSKYSYDYSTINISFIKKNIGFVDVSVCCLGILACPSCQGRMRPSIRSTKSDWKEICQSVICERYKQPLRIIKCPVILRITRAENSKQVQCYSKGIHTHHAPAPNRYIKQKTNLHPNPKPIEIIEPIPPYKMSELIIPTIPSIPVVPGVINDSNNQDHESKSKSRIFAPSEKPRTTASKRPRKNNNHNDKVEKKKKRNLRGVTLSMWSEGKVLKARKLKVAFPRAEAIVVAKVPLYDEENEEEEIEDENVVV